MQKSRTYCLLAALFLLLSGCVSQPTRPQPAGQCMQALSVLLRHIGDAGVQDAQYQPVRGVPVYRSNRFWSSFAQDNLSSEQQQEWRHQLFHNGLSSLALEWQNLPAHSQQQWQQDSGFADMAAFRRQCEQPLWQSSLNQPLSPDSLAIPDSYNTWQRMLGLYAVSRHVARSSIAKYQAEMRGLIQQGPAALQPPFSLYAPEAPQPAPPESPRQFTALGLPVYSPDQLQQLLDWHAPRWQIERRSSADLIGAARWAGTQRAIDTEQPQIYQSVSYVRHENEVLLQLNYLAWFPERPKPTPGDWYGGKLDGLIWRVTLQRDGRVLFYDTIHPCGCYHTLHLPKGSSLRIKETGEEPLMVFHTGFSDRQPRPVLLIQADTHYLTSVLAQPSISTAARPYRMVSYDQLRSLNTEQGRRNWFDPDGLIAESSRRERYYLWPLGVPNAGAMRQQGHHAIAFVGRRHFDAAWLSQLLTLP